jgi:hypothetical protein
VEELVLICDYDLERVEVEEKESLMVQGVRSWDELKNHNKCSYYKGYHSSYCSS